MLTGLFPTTMQHQQPITATHTIHANSGPPLFGHTTAFKGHSAGFPLKPPLKYSSHNDDDFCISLDSSAFNFHFVASAYNN